MIAVWIGLSFLLLGDGNKSRIIGEIKHRVEENDKKRIAIWKGEKIYLVDNELLFKSSKYCTSENYEYFSPFLYFVQPPLCLSTQQSDVDIPF